MNVNYSMTGDKTPERLTYTVKLATQWKTIVWHQAETEVNRLQVQIAKAAQSKKYDKVKQLPYVHKYCNSLYFESRSKEL